MELDAQRRDALAKALQSARQQADLSQKDVERLTDGKVDQSKLSRYESGKNEPPLGSLFAIDRALGREQGYLLELAGLIERGVSVEEAIRSDPSISPDVVQGLLTFYDLGRDAGPSRAEASTRVRKQLEADASHAASRRKRSGDGQSRRRRAG